MLKKIISNNPNVTRIDDPVDSNDYDDNSNDYSASHDSDNSYNSVSSYNPEDRNSSSTKTYMNSMNTRKNILAHDAKIKGSIEFGDDLVIDGTIDGEVCSSGEGNLIVGENANIIGEVKTKSVVVHGKVNGNITVSDKCELKSTAELEGDIKALALSIEEGAKFNGKSSVGSSKSRSSIGDNDKSLNPRLSSSIAPKTTKN